MKILIIGLPYFAKKIAENLNAVDKKNIYCAIDTSGNFKQKIQYIQNIFSASIIYLIGGSTCYGGALKLARILNKKIIMHWVGTDVLNAHRAFIAGNIDANLIKRAKHLTESDWLQQELLEIDICAEIVQIACFKEKIPVPLPFPKQFSILSYMGKGREQFYGIDKLINLAKSFPEIPIRIAGISEYSKSLPSNIKLLGWVEDMSKVYQDSTLYLRLPEHDGLAFSVLESLSYGRYVGYTYAFPYTNKIYEEQDLYQLVSNLRERHDTGMLKINTEGYQFVLESYNRAKVMASLAKILTDIVL